MGARRDRADRHLPAHLRAVRDPADVAAQCVEHLRFAYHGGKIRPVITVFAPDAEGHGTGRGEPRGAALLRAGAGDDQRPPHRRCPGALTPVFHRYYDTERLKPEFVMDDAALKTALTGVPPRGATRGTPSFSPMWTYLRSGQVNGNQAN